MYGLVPLVMSDEKKGEDGLWGEKDEGAVVSVKPLASEVPLCE